MILRFNQEDKFAPRLVWLSAETRSDETEKTEEFTYKDGSKSRVEKVRTPEDADEACDEHEKNVLKEIQNIRNASATRVQQFAEKMANKKVSLDKAVHKYHEDEAIKKLDEKYNGAIAKTRNIRNGRVKRWKAPEVAVATSKLRELSESRKTLESSIREANARSQKYKAMLEQWKKRKGGLFTGRRARVGFWEHKELFKQEPDQVDALKETKDSVSKIENETRSHIGSYDSMFRQKNADYLDDQRKFKDYFFSIPTFLHNEELKLKFDEYLATDQEKRNWSESKIVKHIDESSLNDKQKNQIKDLYMKLLRGDDRAMRLMMNARNARERIDDITFDALNKLKPGQDISITHPVLTSTSKGKSDKADRVTSTVTQNAYVVDSSNGIVKLRVSPSDVSKLGKIKTTINKKKAKVLNGKLPTGPDTYETEEFSYKPKKQTITINTTTGEVTNEFEAIDTSKDGKARPVKLTDTSTFERTKNNRGEEKFKDIRISGNIPKKTLT